MLVGMSLASMLNVKDNGDAAMKTILITLLVLGSATFYAIASFASTMGL